MQSLCVSLYWSLEVFLVLHQQVADCILMPDTYNCLLWLVPSMLCVQQVVLVGDILMICVLKR